MTDEAKTTPYSSAGASQLDQDSQDTVSTYEEWETAYGEITSVMALPFPNLRTLALYGVYWEEKPEQSFAPNPNLKNLTLSTTIPTERELSWLLSAIKGCV